MTRYGHKAPSEFDFSDTSKDVYLVLGKESTGVDKNLKRSLRQLYATSNGCQCKKFKFIQLCSNHRL